MADGRHARRLAVLALPAPRRLRKEWPILDRAGERAYAAAVSAAAGGWLTAATALGPATRRCPPSVPSWP